MLRRVAPEGQPPVASHLSISEGDFVKLADYQEHKMRSNFDPASLYRSSIGFDRLINLLESNQSQSNGGYPPYNVERLEENKYQITIAVAGFAQNELDITAHDNMLTVRGSHSEEQPERTYLYQGIAERNFERKFQLAEHVQVRDARLDLGLLYIDLERIVPEAMKPRRIEILK